MMNLRAAALAVNGQLVEVPGAGGAAELRFTDVSTDSRAVRPGCLFVALIGERFDAHDFVTEVAAKGAVAAIVARSRLASLAVLPDCGLPVIAVDDTRLALGQLAASWRQQFRIPVLAVTGSNGKTTTKEMIAAILRAQAGSEGAAVNAVLATQGNLNNDIGLPLTLLALRQHHRYAVVELGMNHPGEIAYLAKIARPDAALVINALRAHLEGMGSVEGVARGRVSFLGNLPVGGVAVIDTGSEFAPLWQAQAGSHRRFGFSMQGVAEVSASAIPEGLGMRMEISTPSGIARIFLQAAGMHNAHNAAAAAALCLAAGCSLAAVEQGLSAFAGVKGRLQKKQGENGALLIDDTYNANPDSVRAAIDVLAALQDKRPRILVLGDMGETGSAAVSYHYEVGDYARQQGIDRLLALGELTPHAVAAFGAGASHFATPEALAADLKSVWLPDAAVLVKGSRFMRMERVVSLLEAPAENQPNQGAAKCC